MKDDGHFFSLLGVLFKAAQFSESRTSRPIRSWMGKYLFTAAPVKGSVSTHCFAAKGTPIITPSNSGWATPMGDIHCA